MADLDVEALLTPLAGDSPCGDDIEYDAAFLALEETGAGRPERQYGDSIIPAEPPEWPAVYQQALALAERSRDLRVAVWLVRSGARVKGMMGGLQGIQLVNGLLERYWEHVHPLLDASDDNDPTARLSALAPLVHPTAAMADLRSASLTGARGSLTVREVELAVGHVEPVGDESVPSEDGAIAAVVAATDKFPELPGLMEEADAGMRRVTSLIDANVGSSEGVDFKPLLKLLGIVAKSAKLAAGGAPEAMAEQQEGDGDSTIAMSGRNSVGVPGTIASRDDAIKALGKVCDWLERNEPSNPAPLLIRRAQRLMSKNFMDIIRDLVPEGLEQIEKLAGVPSE